MSKLIDLLIEAYGQGYTHDELKKMIISTLTPYFRYPEKAKKYWSSNELLTAFEFLIRYYHDKEFGKSVLEVLDIYRKAFAIDSRQTLAVVNETSFDFSQRENTMWLRSNKTDASSEGNANENIVSYVKHIGEILEIGTKHLIYEIWTLIKIAGGATPEYAKIRNLEFGAVVQNILDQQKIRSVLVTNPLPVNLSDWRNISYHQTYRVSNESEIFCLYGKKHLSFTLNIDALKQYTGQIVKSANILSIARCIFISDYVEDLSADGAKKSPRQTALRSAMLKNRLRLSFLSRSFYLEDVTEESNSISALVLDLTNDGSLSEAKIKERYIHSTTLLYELWCECHKDSIEVKFTNSENVVEFSASVPGEACRKIQRGEKDLSYIVQYVNFEFKSDT